MIRKLAALTFITFALVFTALSLRVAAEQAGLAARLIRLHVVGASDSPADQARKLEVRDALLPEVAALTAGCADAGAAAAAIQGGLPALAEIAARTLGTGEAAAASLGWETFPRRDYPTFSLPAGTYRALRVVIGPGQGHNWWCVAFPALCLPAEEELAETARTAGLEEDQVELMTADTPTVQIKFRLLDWLTDLFG